eukprot:c53620_g1_i1 orf=39-203(-)
MCIVRPPLESKTHSGNGRKLASSQMEVTGWQLSRKPDSSFISHDSQAISKLAKQ